MHALVYQYNFMPIINCCGKSHSPAAMHYASVCAHVCCCALHVCVYMHEQM